MNKYRSVEMKAMASNLDMEYTAKDEWGVLNLLTDFRLFRRGYAKRVKNILVSKDEEFDSIFRIFDYHFVVGAGNSTRRLRQTVFFIDSKQLGLPHFWMKPEHFLHKIGEKFGMQDIDFEAYPTFSNQYLLKGNDESFIRSVIDEEILHFFTFEKNWSLEGINYFMVFYKWNKLLTPKEIQELHRKGMQIFDMFKDP